MARSGINLSKMKRLFLFIGELMFISIVSSFGAVKHSE